jgi:hypothetical protein
VSRYTVVVSGDAPPWARRLEADLNDILTRVRLDAKPKRLASADLPLDDSERLAVVTDTAGAPTLEYYEGGVWYRAARERAWSTALITSTNAAWPVPAGIVEMIIEGWGGGGSGGSGNTSTSARGSGGGAGAYFRKFYSGTMDTTLNITIGAGGTGVVASAGGTAGNAGGTTTVVGTNLGTLTATGGGAGSPNTANGGSGGAATGGDENITGQGGGAGFSFSTSFGSGGYAPRGGLGAQLNVGVAGGTPGGGGSAGNHTAGSFSGSGADGYVLIRTR